MDTLRVMAVVTLLTGCATDPGRPRPSATIADSDQRAATYSGELDAWRQAPEIMLKECNKLDASGAHSRQEIYGQWLQSHSSEISHVEGLNRRAAERLLPSARATGADPAEALRARTHVELYRAVYFMDPAKKSQMCANFSGFPGFDDSKRAASRKEAADYLEKWLAEPRP